MLGSNAIVYMNDILVFAKNEETHLKRLEGLLALPKIRLKIKVKKCKYFTNNIKFLGYTLTSTGIILDDERVQGIKNVPYPNDKKELQAFLGICNYFRSFIRNFADIAKPLYQLLRKGIKFVWTNIQSNAVDVLKSKLCKNPILQFPDFMQHVIYILAHQ